MPTTAGPNIVTDSLVYYVDAANQRSYVSGSHVLTNLGPENSGSFIDSVSSSFDSNPASWGFDTSYDRIEFEDEIARRSGLESGYVAIDVPNIKLLLAEPRMSQVDIRIIGDDGRTRWFREHTPIAEALRNRQVSQAVFYVMTLPGYEDKVSKVSFLSSLISSSLF